MRFPNCRVTSVAPVSVGRVPYKRLRAALTVLPALPRFPNAFAANPGHPASPAGPPLDGGALDAGGAAEVDTLKIEEVQAPATGTRKAKVLYDYDAADTSELSLLADEVSA